MAVKLIKPSALSRTVKVYIPANTAFLANSLISPNNDAITPTALATTAASLTVDGLLTYAISATDYPVATWIDIQRDENGIYEFDVGTGTADINDQGGLIDMKDSDEVDVTASAVDIVRVTQFVSGTKVQGRIVKWS